MHFVPPTESVASFPVVAEASSPPHGLPGQHGSDDEGDDRRDIGHARRGHLAGMREHPAEVVELFAHVGTLIDELGARCLGLTGGGFLSPRRLL